ncbi:MAG: GNAT family N-acetyltransferase [Anaerolineales bacterium]|nr:GNAT family N-acetyltransferase [Anaerolineales bacterium]
MRLFKSLIYLLLDCLKTFKERGGRAGLAELGQTVTRIFYTRLESVVLAKTLLPGEPPLPPLPDLIVRQLKNKEELALLDSWISPKEAIRFRQIFAAGDAAFVALHKGQLAGWGWIAYKIDPQTNRVHVPLAPGEATLYELFVVPAYRGTGVAQRLVASRLELLREQGYKRVVINCTKGNIPAIKLAEKAGYVCVGESCHTRILLWDRLVYRPYPLVEKSRCISTYTSS